MWYAAVAAASFLSGWLLPRILLKMFSGGAPSYDIVPRCENGKIIFKVIPNAGNGCEAVSVRSLVNSIEQVHYPPDALHSRPHPGGMAVNFSARVEYRLAPDNFVSLGSVSVAPCASSSSSSSSLSSSSSSSSR